MGTELDSWVIDNWWDDFYGIDEGDCGLESCIGWDLSGYPLLCDKHLRSVGLDPGWDSVVGCISVMGVFNNCESMENKIMEDFLGTMWWSILCVLVGFAAGVWLKPWLMSKIGR